MKQLLPPVPYATAVLDSSGTLSLPWTGFFKQLSRGWLNIRGSQTNDSADAGYVGEFVSAGSAGVAVAASGTYVAIASISLSAGDWDVEGNAQVNAGALGTVTEIVVGVSSQNSALDSISAGGLSADQSGSNTRYIPTGSRRFSLGQTTTLYLIGSIFYGSGSATWAATSLLRARRVR